jgi:hypothetical protein
MIDVQFWENTAWIAFAIALGLSAIAIASWREGGRK